MNAGKKDTIVVPFDGFTPLTIAPSTQKIEKWNGVYQRAVETKEFIFFVNEHEGDENENTLLFRRDDMGLVSDNYFASAELFEIAIDRSDEITFLSDAARQMIDSIQE